MKNAQSALLFFFGIYRLVGYQGIFAFGASLKAPLHDSLFFIKNYIFTTKPTKMATVNVYLNFNGNCAEAFDFYKSVFGGEFPYIGKFKDMPQQEGMPPMSKEMEDRIMHVSLPISKETMLMGSDTGGEWASSFQQGNNFSISINANSKEEADRLFEGLSSGGKVTMPLANTFWGDYFGMFTDKFGVNWMVSFNTNQQQ